MLFYVILYYIILYYIILYYIILYYIRYVVLYHIIYYIRYIILYHTILYCIISNCLLLYYIILYYIILYYIILYYIILYYIILYVMLCYVMLCYVMLCYFVLYSILLCYTFNIYKEQTTHMVCSCLPSAYCNSKVGTSGPSMSKMLLAFIKGLRFASQRSNPIAPSAELLHLDTQENDNWAWYHTFPLVGSKSPVLSWHKC